MQQPRTARTHNVEAIEQAASLAERYGPDAKFAARAALDLALELGDQDGIRLWTEVTDILARQLWL